MITERQAGILRIEWRLVPESRSTPVDKRFAFPLYRQDRYKLAFRFTGQSVWYEVGHAFHSPHITQAQAYRIIKVAVAGKFDRVNGTVFGINGITF